MGYDDMTDFKERLAGTLGSLRAEMMPHIPEDLSLDEYAIALAREQTATLDSLLILIGPALGVFEIQLHEMNEKLGKIERMVQDLWSAHS